MRFSDLKLEHSASFQLVQTRIMISWVHKHMLHCNQVATPQPRMPQSRLPNRIGALHVPTIAGLFAHFIHHQVREFQPLKFGKFNGWKFSYVCTLHLKSVARISTVELREFQRLKFLIYLYTLSTTSCANFNL